MNRRLAVLPILALALAVPAFAAEERPLAAGLGEEVGAAEAGAVLGGPFLPADHGRLYDLKGQIVAAGIKALTGLDMPVFPKRRFQDGAAASRAALFPARREPQAGVRPARRHESAVRHYRQIFASIYEAGAPLPG